MRLLWENKFRTATLTPNTEDADYPVENMQDTRTTKVFRTTGTTAEVVIAGPITASYFAIVNNNFSTSAVIKIQGNATDSWGSPSLDETVTYSTGIILENFTESTYNYWRISVVDALNTDGYIEMGFAFLGTYLQMLRMKRDQSTGIGFEGNSAISDSGQSFGSKNYDYVPFGVNFNFITDSLRKDIITMFRSVGNITPIIMLAWESNLTFEPTLYCVISQNIINFKRTKSQQRPWALTMNFRETT